MPDISNETLDEVERALVQAHEILHRAQVSSTMDCVNASASDPIKPNLERWRAKCVLAELDATNALARLRAEREVK